MNYADAIAKACLAINTGNKRLAAQILADIIKADPKNGEAWYLLSLVCAPQDVITCKQKAHDAGFPLTLPSAPQSPPPVSSSNPTSTTQASPANRFLWLRNTQLWVVLGTIVTVSFVIFAAIADLGGAYTTVKQAFEGTILSSPTHTPIPTPSPISTPTEATSRCDFTLSEINVSQGIKTDERVRISVLVEKPINKNITFSWGAQSGRMLNPQATLSSENTYIAPSEPGPDTIKVNAVVLGCTTQTKEAFITIVASNATPTVNINSLEIAVRDAFRCATESDIALIKDPANSGLLDECWTDPGRATYIQETEARWIKAGLHACLLPQHSPEAKISNFKPKVFPASNEAEVNATVRWKIIPCNEKEQVQCDEKWTSMFTMETFAILTKIDGNWKVSRRDETFIPEGATTAAQYCSFHNISTPIPESPTPSLIPTNTSTP